MAQHGLVMHNNSACRAPSHGAMCPPGMPPMMPPAYTAIASSLDVGARPRDEMEFACWSTAARVETLRLRLRGFKFVKAARCRVKEALKDALLQNILRAADGCYKLLVFDAWRTAARAESPDAAPTTSGRMWPARLADLEAETC